MKTLMQGLRKHLMRNEIASGPKADQAVNAIWAAMVYHTPALNHALKAYGNNHLAKHKRNFSGFSKCHSLRLMISFVVDQDCKLFLSEEFAHVYLLADSIRTWMVSRNKFVSGLVT